MTKLSKSKQKQIQKELDRKNTIQTFFNQYYESQWGGRWPTLLEALKKPVRHCIMLNKYAIQTKQLELQPLEFVSIPCFVSTTPGRFPPPTKDTRGLSDYYILDAASVLATEVLQVQPNDRVLDLCAAPGGKTLAILQRLSSFGHLTSNEMAFDRRKRLRQVIEAYIPPEVIESSSVVIGKDGTKYNEQPEYYDKVLLDAPCSSERHLLHDEKEFGLWTQKRSQINAKRQFLLLKAALYCVKVDGFVLYSTCSIGSLENDLLIDRMLQKSKIPFQVCKFKVPIGEETKNGWIVLPDQADGWGPLYFSLLKRTGTAESGSLSENEEEEE
jgi:16S rRNA C967 or C1407 C5-methylase (RsmB/RsmF family)